MGPSTNNPPIKAPANGYQTLGNYMGLSPEYAVFHGFRDLYAENLLYLQADIKLREKQLRNIQKEDRKDPRRKTYHQDWERLCASAAQEDGLQIQKILELREALDKYYDSLFRYEKIINMKKPKSRTLKNMYEWTFASDTCLVGDDWNVFEGQNPQVMVSLDRTFDDDLTAWIQTTLVETYHKLIGRSAHKSPAGEKDLEGFVSYPIEKVSSASRFIAAGIACALPTASIFGLHFIASTTVRLGVVLAMSVLFAICMAWMTSAKTQEIFSSTATFAAVLVVFVSTDAGNN
ncbi:hypothetical protein B0T25DRAFT_560558 [Lasiosphaeria hispida]|uniref:DUF6594 domain-containing protein n=1 Tax=Lasiosphaeria hispida TaxID=260671 RepID=A0AAJ0H5L0_9PEZI|nr:hypothetical protein B0T25DRAFT_560558 [Lasiosphaeria hispida]